LLHILTTFPNGAERASQHCTQPSSQENYFKNKKSNIFYNKTSFLGAMYGSFFPFPSKCPNATDMFDLERSARGASSTCHTVCEDQLIAAPNRRTSDSNNETVSMSCCNKRHQVSVHP
jgi:hypothetical protein